MAIRFRCPHCRQLLGISVGQIGQVVDCPTCGRSLRVPQRSGKAKAVTAKPKLNLQDDDLSAALDELVALGQSAPVPPVGLGQPSLEAGAQPTPPSPAQPTPPVAPQPIPVAPLPPIEVTDVPLESTSLASAAIARANPIANAPQQPVNIENELDQLAQVATPGRPVDISEFEPNPRRVWFLPAVVTMIVGFAGGYFTRQIESNIKPQPLAYQTNKPDFSLDSSPISATPAALTGRVLYSSNTGEDRPDAGARVVALPVEKLKQDLIATPGLRPGDPAAERERLVKAVRDLGGDVAVVQSDGQFHVDLPIAGEYHVLVLSHYQPRPDVEIATPVRSFVEQWFDRGTNVLGQVSYAFDRIAYNGTDAAHRDYNFPR